MIRHVRYKGVQIWTLFTPEIERIMSKSQTNPPKIGNNGGTAFVRINGKRIYLGKFGSPEARQNYARCVAEWAITANNDPGQPSPTVGSITVDSLMIAFLDYSRMNYPKQYSEFRLAAKVLLSLYSGITVESFTPKCLAAVQYQFTQQIGKKGKRYSRQYCNRLTKYIRQMFRWGVAQELVSPVTADALKYIQPLQRGRTEAPESPPRVDVPNSVVDVTLPHLPPTVATMVQVQRLAVMRPNEICRMRICDIDMSRKDGIWLYCPPDHKGAWRGHGRVIPLGETEQILLTPYLEQAQPDAPLFFNRRGKQYHAEMYGDAIQYAIRKVNRSLPDDQKIPHWTPYQLRHAGVTELTLENDGNLDVARAVAGQKSIGITQIYNHADLKIAIEQAKKRKRPPESPEAEGIAS